VAVTSDLPKTEQFAERLFEASGHAMDTFCVYLGDLAWACTVRSSVKGI
jgi:hypothetical protein